MPDPSGENWRQRFNQVLVFGSALVILLVLTLAAVLFVFTVRLKATRRALDSATARVEALEAEVSRLEKSPVPSPVVPPRAASARSGAPVPAPPERTRLASRPTVEQKGAAGPSSSAPPPGSASASQPANGIAARRLRGEQAIRRGDYAVARQELEPVVATNPADAEARFWFGVALFHIGLLDEADRQFEWLTANEPKSAEGFYWRGMVPLRRLEADRALRFFDQAVAADPAFAPAWESGGVALANLGKLGEALQRLDEAARLSPTRAQIPFAQSVCHARLERRQEAIDALRRAVSLDPKLIDRARATPALDHILREDDWQKLVKR
jgi:tetratricopeptide (TPR) repeat protein